ncbi:RagB/SusD family nutrient uptake outer membrane protein [Aquimarina longa]|uniref:RagB/SusD family nutrient uptake outer membrane protein n=1 Tax=Aquimarina longa TaxID=1080221 RepID=UPI0009E8D320|nr:RagB/SusD family nutrient uptake outer membrane protein [Aquimarina longa]
MKKYLIILITLFFVTSCNDEIEDLKPFSQGDPSTFFNSVRTFQLGVDGALQQMRLYYEDAGSGLQGIPDILSDNVIISRSGRLSNRDYYEYTYNPNTLGPVSLYFYKAYNSIRTANTVIKQIDNLPAGEDRDNILGQALAIRAYAHFDLARIYAKIPTQSDDANGSLGVAYIKAEDGDTEDELAKPKRETVAANYTEIIEDLEKALTLVGVDNGLERFNKNSINGILSRVYLYNGDYQKAIDAADKVTTKIIKGDKLDDLYTDVTQDGIVFTLAINSATETRNNNVGVLYNQSNDDGVRSEYVIDHEFYNSIPDTDPRKAAMRFVGKWEGNDYNAVKKFLGEAGENNGRVDIKVLRAAEVILNKAEAQYELGKTTEALATLDLLRAERNGGAGAGGETGAALEDAIQFNRRIELAFEGHRFFDIKRRGEDLNRSNKGDLIDGTGTPPVAQTVSAGNFRFQLPIPISERNVNPDFNQNPGY